MLPLWICQTSSHSVPLRMLCASHVMRRDTTKNACQSAPHSRNSSTASSLLTSIVVPSTPNCPSTAVVDVSVNGASMQTLADTGSSDSYVSSFVVHRQCWKIEEFCRSTIMVSKPPKVVQSHYLGNRATFNIPNSLSMLTGCSHPIRAVLLRHWCSHTESSWASPTPRPWIETVR